MANKETNTEVATVKIKVVQPFLDKFNNKVRYEPGDELEFDPERAADVVDRDLAEYILPIG